MAIVIPNFELAETIGERVEIDATTVGELVRVGAERYGEAFRQATKRAAIMVNGRSVSLLKGSGTRIGPDDTVWFVLPAGGG
jgi:molybdopterin converting factor small subunit